MYYSVYGTARNQSLNLQGVAVYRNEIPKEEIEPLHVHCHLGSSRYARTPLRGLSLPKRTARDDHTCTLTA